MGPRFLISEITVGNALLKKAAADAADKLTTMILA
jgi:hypothetical protein